MFETLTRHGGYRIDYLKPEIAGHPEAFGFYVCGSLPEDAVYSTSARRQLLAGLSAIQSQMNPDQLVAIYVDINNLENLFRGAYQQLKRDVREGLIQRVFVISLGDLIDGPESIEDMTGLFRDSGGFEIISLEDGICQRETFAYACYRWVMRNAVEIYEAPCIEH